MFHINLVLIAKTGTFIQAMDFVIAHLGAAEQVVHDRTEHLPAKLADRVNGGRDQNMHAVVVWLCRIMPADLILAGAIAFDQKRRFAIATAD